METQAACDKKPLCRNWARAGRSSLFKHVHCFYESIADLTARQGKCAFHPRNALCKVWRRPDCTAVGLPCSPYSSQRGNRHQITTQDHPDFQALLDFVLYVDRVRPRGGWIEEVMGFASKIREDRFRPTLYARELPQSWASWLVCRLREKGYHVRVFKLDNIHFSDVPRERTALVL